MISHLEQLRISFYYCIKTFSFYLIDIWRILKTTRCLIIAPFFYLPSIGKTHLVLFFFLFLQPLLSWTCFCFKLPGDSGPFENGWTAAVYYQRAGGFRAVYRSCDLQAGHIVIGFGQAPTFCSPCDCACPTSFFFFCSILIKIKRVTLTEVQMDSRERWGKKGLEVVKYFIFFSHSLSNNQNYDN